MTTKTNSYPLFIILLISCFLGFSAWSAIRAIDAGPEVTDPDYYSKGLKYSSTVLEKRTAAVLGWKVETLLTGRTIEFHLSDKEGKPVETAKGDIFLYLAGSTKSKQLPLKETEPGVYIFNLTSHMTGEINARLEFERKGARINRQLLLNL
jgi:nitrogen fixation protein FixH